MKNKYSKVDYSKASLPRTRREQFLDCFKMNYPLILKAGLIILVSFLPMLIFSFLADYYYASLMSVSKEAVAATKMVYYNLFGVGIILFSMVAMIGISGVLHVFRNLIWGEGIYFKEDMKDGIKENYWRNVLHGLVCSIFFVLAFFLYSIFPETIIAYAALFLFALIFLPIYFWIIYLNNTYQSTFWQLIKNGFYFYIKTIGWSILMVVITLIPVFVIFIPMTLIYLKYIILLLYFAFVFPSLLLMINLYTTSIFDKYINKDNYSDFYKRGLNDN